MLNCCAKGAVARASSDANRFLLRSGLAARLGVLLSHASASGSSSSARQHVPRWRNILFRFNRVLGGRSNEV